MLTMHLAASLAHGAQPILFAATSPQVRGGDYIGPGGRSGLRGPPAPVRSSERELNVAGQRYRRVLAARDRLAGGV